MVKAVPRTLSAPIGTKNGHNPSSKLRGEPSVKSRAKGSSTAVKSTVRATAKKLAVPEVVAPKSIALPVKSGSTARPSAKKISSKTSKSPTTSQANYDIVTNTTNRVRKAGEVVAERFRKEIAQGILAIGHQLPSEEELTASFGIARTTLREALRVLESQGLLEIKRGRGGGGIITMPRLDNLSQSLALVLQLQRTSLGDLDDARMMIEPPLAGRLATHHSDEDLEVLAGIVEHAHRASEANDRNDFGKAAAALHEEIIARGGNNTMAVLGALLHDLLERHFHAAALASDQDHMRRAVRSYRKLLELIESGDSAATSAHWHRQLVFLQDRRASIQLLDVYNE